MPPSRDPVEQQQGVKPAEEDAPWYISRRPAHPISCRLLLKASKASGFGVHLAREGETAEPAAPRLSRGRRAHCVRTVERGASLQPGIDVIGRLYVSSPPTTHETRPRCAPRDKLRESNAGRAGRMWWWCKTEGSFYPDWRVFVNATRTRRSRPIRPRERWWHTPTQTRSLPSAAGTPSFEARHGGKRERGVDGEHVRSDANRWTGSALGASHGALPGIPDISQPTR
ncbi:hypothetical protein BV20DRAFT_199567 [Pilatotrama ljubarskyi]|nr:hypothetical protein BV20DRAFT_199567 [Pilatotrama ljubarskyi]